jgi:membrane fusion protein (multidrug efflux system)/multidrug efflux system membrane fusion protein
MRSPLRQRPSPVAPRAAAFGLALLLGCLGLVGGVGCKGGDAKPEPKKGGGKGGSAFPVEVVAVEARRVDYVVNAVGSVDAFEQVQVTARVAGAVEQVRFAEGDVVQKGAALVEIEVQRYQLAVKSAQASMERARAARLDADSVLSRRERGAAEGISTQEELQTARTRVATALADISTAESALSLAQLNLRDAFVRAPVSGTIQTRTVTTGMYVQPGTILATLVQRDPLLLRFQVPEFEATGLATKMHATFRVRGMDKELGAVITSVNQKADPLTRMVAVIAEIEAPPAELRPGSFAEVTVPVGGMREAPVIPQTAVRPSERGFLSFVIETDKEGDKESTKAKERVLELGLRTAEGLVEVRKGVAVGERLVIRGAEALSDGATVKIVPAGTVRTDTAGTSSPGPSGVPTLPAAPPASAAPAVPVAPGSAAPPPHTAKPIPPPSASAGRPR